MRNRFLNTGAEWTPDFILKSWKVIDKLAAKFKWKGFEPQFEIVTSEQMIDNSSFTGMPIMYSHWSLGKQKLQMQEAYTRGRTSLALEMIINSDPAICYLNEDNSACAQIFVLAHAAVGHSHFFKNNYMFKEWTSSKTIIEYLIYAREYIEQCEQKYGEQLVEFILDAAHSLKHNSLDHNKRKSKKSLAALAAKRKVRLDVEQENKNVLYSSATKVKKNDIKTFICAEILNNPNLFEENTRVPETNLLYYLEKNSTILKPWQREILRIVRNIEQYFYPQMHTKLMNEGFASFVHYTMMNELYDQKYIPEGYMLEFLHSHSDVIFQPDWYQMYYRGINPYKLGFEMFKDIRRICEHPTEEDKQWFPELIGANWVDVINHAVANYRDESFVQQFLSPHLVRELKLFEITNYVADEEFYHVTNIQSDSDFKELRNHLAQQYNVLNHIPNIEVWYQDKLGDQSLVMAHISDESNKLNEDTAQDVLKNIAALWGKAVLLYNVKYIDGRYEAENGYFKEELPKEYIWAVRGS